MRKRYFMVTVSGAMALTWSAFAQADGWWPHPSDASWTYRWSDSVYNNSPTSEKVTVEKVSGKSFVLSWTTKDQDNSDAAPISFGHVTFQETKAGLVNTAWAGSPPPPDYPILCPQVSGCNNSLGGTMYDLIWGSRSPMLALPLLRGMTWQGVGGAQKDVASRSSYEGTEFITVPAFPQGILTARVRTEITQTGALGDPYGSGVRTVWWAFGVGPVKLTFEHAGPGAPLTTSELRETNLVAKAPPSDINYFPFVKGRKLKYRWENSRYLRRPSVQQLTVAAVLNSSGRFTVKQIGGPIRVAGSYGFSTRTDGVTNVFGLVKAATPIRFPPLGPRSLPAGRRPRFVTPFDLMTYGLGRLLPAYPSVGQTWASKHSSRDFSTFGVSGTAKIVGIRRVSVPAGRFRALVVRATLNQAGFAFGSGTRTTYFVGGKGVVKLVFRHRYHSISTVELLK